MSNCKLQTLYFAATKFEVLDEFEGEQGTFIKSFLISNKLNLNDWEVTAEANREDGQDFIGKPGIEFFKEGRRDHTVGNTYNNALNLQEPFRKATIRKVLGTETGEKLSQVSRVFDEDIIAKIRSKEIEFVSPAIFPRSVDDVKIIERPDGTHIHRVLRYRALHYAFVNQPAFGGEARIEEICEGPECLLKLSKASKDIPPIIRVAKCAKTGNTTVQISGETELSKKVSECLSQKLTPGEEPTDQDIAICFSEARDDMKKSVINSQILKNNEENKKMANVDLTEEKKKDFEARIAQLEDNDEKRDKEAKKAKKAVDDEETKKEKENTAAQDDDDNDKDKMDSKKSKKAKKAVDEEETKKEKEMTSKIATLTARANIPIIEEYIAARKMIGDDEDKLELTRTAMLKASVEENESKLDEIKPFIAHLNFNNQANQESAKTVTHPYGMGGDQFSASTSTKSAEEMYEELYP